MVSWDLLRPLLQVPDEKYVPPSLTNDHGTHVAGILAADWRCGEIPQTEGAPPEIRGVCPTLELIDLRVFPDKEPLVDEFTIISALQFIRYLNSQGGPLVI